MGYQGWVKMLVITMISNKKVGVYKIMRNTVCIEGPLSTYLSDLVQSWMEVIEYWFSQS